MANEETDIHTVKLVDIPLVKRLIESGLALDSELACTRAVHSDLFSTFFLPQRGLHTLMARAGKEHVVGQFRLKPDETHARIVYLAPGLNDDDDDTAWLHILDAMAAEAGRRGAHILTAEVDEFQPLFETMRVSGFSIYARQEIWQRNPDRPFLLPEQVDPMCAQPVTLTEATEADAHGIHLLYTNIVPRLVQPIATPPSHTTGYVYRRNDRVEGYVALSEGRNGIYLLPYLHPDVFSEAAMILAAAITQASRLDRVPVYVCVRRYQDWLEDALIELGFEPAAQQALMVRHIAAGVRHTAFAPLSHRLEAVPNSINPPKVAETLLDYPNQE